MSQKDYNIIEYLQKKPVHLRELARLLNTNQTTTARKLKALYTNNIIDYRQEGKNKVFFLKDSLEAKQQIIISEIKKLLEAIKRYPRLRRIVEAIKNNKEIKLAFIFGSYAKGLANSQSDIDIYINTEKPEIKQVVERIDSKISVKTGLFDTKSILIQEILKNHIIIKGFEEYYELLE